jgi:hypothetical protein
MDHADLIVLPRQRTDPVELDLVQVDAAIEMVRRGAAARMRLAGLADAADLASTALARAQEAGVEFALHRDGSSVTLTFGPKRTDP